MRKVMLRMNEQERYEIIKNLIENNGNKYIASVKLNCSLIVIQWLIKKYKLKEYLVECEPLRASIKYLLLRLMKM